MENGEWRMENGEFHLLTQGVKSKLLSPTFLFVLKE